mmetsp:Transcript_19116/g.53498  ORF Transcript_19116/g.53498 Transcript_19116/m.53498 type:complete len:399 (-) Transcript_19116:306-1502(-)
MQRASEPCSYLLRYYGKSQPFGPKPQEGWKVDPRFLSVPQALADYACLVQYIKKVHGAQDSPVIVFGGSYGGELAVWMRLKYPHIVAGAIAASAPVLGYPDEPGFSPSSYWKVVTRDATPAAGAAPGCSSRVRLAFQTLMESAAGDPVDRAVVASRLRLCSPLARQEDMVRVAYWLQGAFDAYAMGNYPYPSSYINGDDTHPLPAWPMRAACQLMTQEGKHVLESMADAVGVLYNATGEQRCYDASTSGPAAGSDLGPWDFQVCTEQMAQEQPYWPANGKTDMFWDQGPYNFTAVSEHCMKAWGLRPDRAWPTVQFGGLQALKQASNIVFSNGEFDPWSAFGVLSNISSTVHAVFISEGAHHLDLMWSNPADPPSVRSARSYEMQQIAAWIKDFKGAS